MFRPLAAAAFLLSLLSLGVSIAAYRRPVVTLQPVPMLNALYGGDCHAVSQWAESCPVGVATQNTASDPFCSPLGDDAWSRWDASCRINATKVPAGGSR